MKIRAKIFDDKRFVRMLQAIHGGGIKSALTAMGDYFVGNESRGLKHYPAPRPSKYVRTFTLRAGWKYTVPSGNKLYVSNPVPYSGYVQGNPPATHMKKRGWRSWMDVIGSNMSGALRAGESALLKWVRSK